MQAVYRLHCCAICVASCDCLTGCQCFGGAFWQVKCTPQRAYRCCNQRRKSSLDSASEATRTECLVGPNWQSDI